MVHCKFQTDVTGSSMLVYSEDRRTVFATINNDPRFVASVTLKLGMKTCLGKCFAVAKMNAKGRLKIGDKLPDQGW